MSNIIKDIYDHIRKAETEALKRKIKINQIIIDKDLAITNNLYIQGIDEQSKKINPMILGLAIDYQENLRKDDGYNFIIGYNERIDTKNKDIRILANFTKEELLQELLMRETNGI